MKNMEGLWDAGMIGYDSKPLDVKNAFQAEFKGHDLSQIRGHLNALKKRKEWKVSFIF